jgi:hypothetical protein
VTDICQKIENLDIGNFSHAINMRNEKSCHRFAVYTEGAEYLEKFKGLSNNVKLIVINMTTIENVLEIYKVCQKIFHKPIYAIIHQPTYSIDLIRKINPSSSFLKNFLLVRFAYFIS